MTTPDAGEMGRTTRYYASLADIPWSRASQPLVDDHVWQYSRDELLDVIARSGFQVDRLAFAPGMVSRHFNLQLSMTNS